MQFTLQSLLLSFVVVASALAAFDGWGLLVAAVILTVVGLIRSGKFPRLTARDIYSQYRFDEPWDGPNNRKLAAIPLRLFQCPCDFQSAGTHTSYVAVVGPETLWPGADPASLDDLEDESESTVILVEVEGTNISWAEPRDLALAELEQSNSYEAVLPLSLHRYDLGYFHHSGWCTTVATADGAVHAIDGTTSCDTWRALLTRAGGEAIGGDWDESVARHLHWGHIGGLICLVLSTLLLLLRPIRRNIAAPTFGDNEPSGG